MSKKNKIRPIAICLFRHGDRILVVESTDRSTGQNFVRPAGGGIDFGETSLQAIAREIQEELDAEITQVRFLGVLESRFECHGEPGHEIVFVYDAVFADRRFYDQDEIPGQEGDDKFMAVWRSLGDLRTGRVRLVPEGLWTLLEG